MTYSVLRRWARSDERLVRQNRRLPENIDTDDVADFLSDLRGSRTSPTSSRPFRSATTRWSVESAG